jgi:predicted nucleic acid-binding Zn ribbon protein
MKCKHCETRFTPKRDDARYCSASCRSKAHYQRHKVSLYPTTMDCLADDCEREFTAVRYGHWFCSDACRKRFKRSLY